MHVHPAIAALRGGDAPQRPDAAATAMEESLRQWRARRDVAAIEAQCRAYGDGAALDGEGALGRLLGDLPAARQFVAAWRGHFLRAARAHPLGEAPMRYRCSPGLTAIRLCEAGRAELSLVAYEKRPPMPAPESAVFTDRDCTEIVIAGEAEGLVHRIAGDAVTSARAIWHPGDVIALRGVDEARQIVRVSGAMVLLQLVRTPENPRETREIALATGKVVRRASGCKRASGKVMAAAVLGALGAGADALECAALDRGEDREVRWEALRQALAMDSAAGMRLLERLAARTEDPLAPAARALCDQLVARHPVLARKAA